MSSDFAQFSANVGPALVNIGQALDHAACSGPSSANICPTLTVLARIRTELDQFRPCSAQIGIDSAKFDRVQVIVALFEPLSDAKV